MNVLVFAVPLGVAATQRDFSLPRLSRHYLTATVLATPRLPRLPHHSSPRLSRPDHALPATPYAPNPAPQSLTTPRLPRRTNPWRTTPCQAPPCLPCRASPRITRPILTLPRPACQIKEAGCFGWLAPPRRMVARPAGHFTACAKTTARRSP